MSTYHQGVSAPQTPTLDTAASQQLRSVVAGMTCEHCQVAVEREVGRVAGVTSVVVDLETKLVTVDGTELHSPAVVAAIDEAGYDAEATA